MAYPYDPRIAEMVLELVSGGFTLEQIEKIDGMPRRVDFLRWRRKNATLNMEYMQAVNDRMALSFDRLYTVVNKLMDPETETTGQQRAHYKLALDTLTKMLKSAAVRIATGEDLSPEDGEEIAPAIQLEFIRPTEDDPRSTS